LDRGPGCTPRLSSNLLRHAKLTLLSGHRHFCANLLNLSKFRCRVKLRFCGNQACNSSSSAGSFTCLFDRRSGEVNRPQKVALRKISKNDRHQMPSATKAHERAFLPGHAMGLFSAGFPTGAWMSLRFRPTNRLPTSPLGAGPKATGRLHCYICNFLRVAQATLLCKSRIALSLAPFRDFLRIATAHE
jgi:hypothetical protein